MRTHRRLDRVEAWPHATGHTAAWAGVVLVGLLFVGLGAGKLLLPAVAAEFNRLGLPAGMRLLIGAAEVAGGLLVLRPGTWVVGVGTLAIMFLLAVGDHFFAGRDGPLVPFLVPLALLASVAVAARARDRIAWWDRYAATLDRYAAGEAPRGR